MSATQSWFGRVATNCRLTRSVRALQRIVADGGPALRTAPDTLNAKPFHQNVLRCSGPLQYFPVSIGARLCGYRTLVCSRPRHAEFQPQATDLVCFGQRPCPDLSRMTYARNRWMGRSATACRSARPHVHPMFVNKRHHYLTRRPSSAWAKKAAALRSISLACFNSRFSRSSSLSRSRSVEVMPLRLP